MRQLALAAAVTALTVASSLVSFLVIPHVGTKWFGVLALKDSTFIKWENTYNSDKLEHLNRVRQAVEGNAGQGQQRLQQQLGHNQQRGPNALVDSETGRGMV